MLTQFVENMQNYWCMQFWFLISQTVDFDFHDALRRGVEAYREAEHCMASILMASASTLEHEAKGLNFISDRAAFMQENQALFTPPPTVQFIPYPEDEVSPRDLCVVFGNITI